MGRIKRFERSDVIEKSTRLFWKMGYAKTSLQALEKNTGLNKSSLYSEFKDKSDLFSSCIEQYSETHCARSVLMRRPLGLKNVFDFLTLEGPKHKSNDLSGCFITNSVREFAILPQQARTRILTHMRSFNLLVKKNLLAAGVHSRKIDSTCELVLSLSVGIALRSNIQTMRHKKKAVQSFFRQLFGESFE